MASLNLNSLKLQESTILHLEHPDTISGPLYGDDTTDFPVTIEVWGTTSKVYRNFAAIRERKNAEKKNGNKTLTADAALENNAEFYANITKKINNLDVDGQPLDNFDAIKAMYLHPEYSWVALQVGEKFLGAENFLAK